MNFQQLIRKLRTAADALEALIDVEIDRFVGNENPETAHLIRQSFKRSAPRKAANKGYRYSGTHWTQQPENKARLRKITKRASRARYSLSKQASPLKGKQFKGTHWTQTAEGKRKMAAVQKRAWRARKERERAMQAAVEPERVAS